MPSQCISLGVIVFYLTCVNRNIETFKSFCYYTSDRWEVSESGVSSSFIFYYS